MPVSGATNGLALMFVLVSGGDHKADPKSTRSIRHHVMVNALRNQDRSASTTRSKLSALPRQQNSETLRESRTPSGTPSSKCSGGLHGKVQDWRRIVRPDSGAILQPNVDPPADQDVVADLEQEVRTSHLCRATVAYASIWSTGGSISPRWSQPCSLDSPTGSTCTGGRNFGMVLRRASL